MKFFLVLLLIQTAYAASVVPDRVITPPLDIYSFLNNESSPGTMSVRQLKISETGDLIQSDELLRMTKPFYDSFRGMADAVYEVRNGGNEASAVHIGHNLVLTNHHVLTNMNRWPMNCKTFQIKDKDSDLNFFCKKVHFCSLEHDVCIVEMFHIIKTTRPCYRCQKESKQIAMGASLKLASKIDYDDMAITTAIGNTLGLGIHASQGVGLRFFDPDIAFYAPTATGNSGGALLNSNGFLIGIVKSGTILKISNDPIMAFNMAIGSAKIIELVQGALRNDLATLEKFNQAITE